MPLRGKSPRIRSSVDGAMSEVGETADFYEKLGKKIEKFGVRIEVVQLFPKPVFDIKIKDK